MNPNAFGKPCALNLVSTMFTRKNGSIGKKYAEIGLAR
jgi:hypothetical protein